MITAKVEGTASVNYGPFEWTTIAGDSHHLAQVTETMRQRFQRLAWGEGFSTHLVHLPGEIVIVAADRVSRVPGHDSEWAIEKRDSGVVATRPNGIKLCYSIKPEDVRTHGLPHRSQVEAAFREDALQALKTAYAQQAPGPALSREFPPHSLPHDREWAAFERDMRRPAESYRSSTPREPIKTDYPGSKKNPTPHGTSLSRRGMMVTGVVIGAIAVGYLAWKIFRKDDQTKSR